MTIGRHAARIELLVALALLVGACGSGGGKSGTGGASGAGGASGSGVAGRAGGAGSPGGAGGAGGAAVTCTTSASGCQCHEGPPADQELTCTPTSVATGAGDVGVCCQGFLCSCTAYICRYESGLNFCSCAPSYTVTGIVNGPVVTSCPVPTGNVKCCFEAALNNCTCAPGDCAEPLDEVPSCSIADVTVCQNGDARVGICATGSGGSGTGGSGTGGSGTGGFAGSTGGASGGASGHAGGGAGGGAGAAGAGGQPSGGIGGHAGSSAGNGGSSAGASGHGGNVDGGAADAPDAAPCGFDGGCSRAKGARCSADGECLSGHCVDGFCCDSACTGACVSCGVAGSEGTCLSILHGTDFRSCAGASTCGPDGTCKEAEGQSCTAASQCALGACPASTCCADSSCDRAYGWSHLSYWTNESTMATGPAGQIALFGELNGCVDVDPGPAVQTVCSPNNATLSLLTLLDADGRYLWSRVWAGSTSVGPKHVAFVPGGLVVTDVFTGSVDFDPSNPAATQTAPGAQSVYLSRFDLNGNWSWAQTWGAQGVTFVNLAVGMDGTIAIVGYWFGTLDLDPGAAVVSETNSTSKESYFLLKLASDGTYAWHNLVPTWSVDSVAVASDGSIGIGGRFLQATDFDPGPGTTTMTPNDGRAPWDFISVFDTTGTFMWARSFSTSSPNGNDAANVAALEGGGWAVAATFHGVQADFDPLGAHDKIPTHWTASHQPDVDIFLSYVTATGGYVKTWATGSTSDDYLGGLGSRKGGGVWLSAMFYGSTDIDPGSGTTMETGPVLLEIGSQMEYLWSVQPATTFVPFAPSPADSSVILLTPITAATDFDPGPGTDILKPLPQTSSAVVLTKFWP
jgi:hypothetical protein